MLVKGTFDAITKAGDESACIVLGLVVAPTAGQVAPY